MKKMKSILTISSTILLFASCKKEILENSPKPQVTQNQQKLHRTGVILDDPSSLEKIGYYNIESNLRVVTPSSIDLSGKMPAIADQGDQYSGVGWAVGYYCKTYQEVVEKGWNVNENAYSPSWIYNQINGGKDEGSAIENAMSLLVDKGCDFKDNFPYYPYNYTNKPDDGSKINAAHYKSSSWKYLQKTTENFKNVLAFSQVFVISIPIYPDFDNLSEDNPIYNNWSGISRGIAAVCVVGYDDSKQAFKFVNSWGTDWGINGYGWIAYNKIPDIYAAYVLTDKTNTYDTKYLIGDFNGDKIQDVFTSNGYRWYVSLGGKNGLKKLATSSITTSSLAVGDFNGDGKSDIFYPNGSEWKVSYSGTGSWTKINSSVVTLSNMKFGDFNGDKKTDVFYPNGSEWKVSYSGATGWNVINKSVVTIDYLDLGDFNGDGKSDVFYANGSEWKVSYFGTTGWNKINGSTVKVNYLKLADFNGDKKCDVFYPNGSEWKICYSGTGDWIRINGSVITLKDLGFGNFNNDSKCDVFHPTTAYWKVSWSGTSDWEDL
jgi:C1A family cysteine protease